MVHLVRLSTILNDPADSAIPCNDSEEHRVQEISRQILSGYSDLLPKLDSFCSSRPHLDAIADNPNQYQEVQ
jgi:hypothetical protein